MEPGAGNRAGFCIPGCGIGVRNRLPPGGMGGDTAVVGRSRTLRAASGWLELGLPGDALCELSRLPTGERDTPAALRLRLAAQMEQETWNAAADTARLLCLKRPREVAAFLHAAYCLHETGDTLAARDWLLRGPRELLAEPLFHYNMACYQAVLGEACQARHHLTRALELDPALETAASVDADLDSLRA